MNADSKSLRCQQAEDDEQPAQPAAEVDTVELTQRTNGFGVMQVAAEVTGWEGRPGAPQGWHHGIC